MGKIVGLTYDLKEDYQLKEGDPKDACAELDQPKTIDAIQSALQKGGHKIKRIGNVFKLLKEINTLGVDIIFNICEGLNGRNRESQVPNILEMYGIPFVGADALTLGMTLDKVVAKKMFISEGIPTPRYFVANAKTDLKAVNTIGFPLIVKTKHEGSSKGIDVNARVENLEQLKSRVDYVNKVYKQEALVEEFIRGSEVTAAVLGNENPEAMPVVQVSMDGSIDLGDKFYSFERLSVQAATLKYICPAKLPKKTEKYVQELALKVYNCVGCRDFGRVDFRIDENGNPYVLEINPLPCLLPEDTFGIFPEAIGSTYDETVNKILDFALKRYNMR
ncbi:MAG: ATP-grasp domain-containing protein [Candidatus Omnitrophica bacterium]|nr:ATP-grasp domain-containing protein [Candidatus Omnitrophota bacterium]